VRPKPYQKPHPPIWVAALQPATYELAAELGIGVMALSVAAPSYLAPHIKQYKERVRHAKPVGKFVNDQWLSSTMALCDSDGQSARELAAKSLRTFFGPDRPYLKDQTHLYEQLVASWGGVPEHLKANFSRYLKGRGAAGAPEVDLSGGSGQIASACGIRSTPTPWSSAACSWPATRRAACAGSRSTRRPGSTSCSS
jgi:alkanesulfonate monooxygenase SsuD/methylene tetrahydromethanopterin reductase-like flavin-dependent oxidoreductase (luciferase family)